MTQELVLDHGFVELVSHMGDDNTAIRSARVSYNRDQRTGSDPEADDKLRRYLLKHNHSTPFESMACTFHVKAPIFVVRQWHRHRTWSYNEVSARYTELDEGYYTPTASVLGTQSANNKQGRTFEVSNQKAELLRQYIEDACETSFAEYRRLLHEGCPRELARSVLPVAAYTRMYATANLHNIFRFLALRLDPHAQYEIRVYAEAIESLLHCIFPRTMRAWRETRGD